MMMRDRFWTDFALGSLITCGGLGAFALIIHAFMPSPRPTTPMTAVIDQRWPPPLEKTDRLQYAAAVEAGTLEPPLGYERPAPAQPIEQAVERKKFESDVEREEGKYHRAARKHVADNDDDDRPRDVCERHGMRKRVFYRHHHQSWRCVGHYRR
jgi:hypothetical protein